VIQIRALLDRGTETLIDSGVEEAQLKMEWLLSERLDIPRLELSLHYRDSVDATRIEADIARLAGHEPLQYVLGTTNFMGHDFATDARALIPRPETEELVEYILDLPSQPIIHDVLDVGTGTGCIALSLAAARPGWVITASDISTAALNLARENAAALKLEGVHFIEADLLAGFPPASFDLIVSNPPYIAQKEVLELDRHVRDYEPQNALTPGAAGTEALKTLIDQAARALRPGGRLALEMGEDQGGKVKDFLHKAGFTDILILEDRYNNVRFAHGILPHGSD
jgi:release factor glutamine methyltransferase